MKGTRHKISRSRIKQAKQFKTPSRRSQSATQRIYRDFKQRKSSRIREKCEQSSRIGTFQRLDRGRKWVPVDGSVKGAAEHGYAGGHAGKEAFALILLGASHLYPPTPPKLKPKRWELDLPGAIPKWRRSREPAEMERSPPFSSSSMVTMRRDERSIHREEEVEQRLKIE